MDEEDQFNAEAGGSGQNDGEVNPRSNQPTGSEEKPGISKNAQKKAARLARHIEQKPAKRQAEKARRQQRAHELSAGYAEGTLSEADKEIFEARKAREREKRNAKKINARSVGDGGNGEGSSKQAVWRGAVIMDLGFDELMTDNEIASMDSQVTYSYSTNRLSALPFSALIHTSASLPASPRLMGRLGIRGIERWSRCHWCTDTLDTLAQQMQKKEQGELPAGLRKGQELVYLSADSEHELTTLDENEVYIIGGLVDRNRHKNLCQNKAERLGIRTARLPIGTYLENLPTRKVLTVNQVFAILVEFNIRKDWKAAFEAVIPPRKFVEKKRKRGNWKVSETGDEVVGDDDSEDGESVSRSLAGDTVEEPRAVVADSEEESAMNL